MIRGALAGSRCRGGVGGGGAGGGPRLPHAAPAIPDVRLLGALVTRDGARWRAAGTGAHLVNGAVFGAVFTGMGGGGVYKQGLGAAQAENLALWPGMAVVDRMHPGPGGAVRGRGC